MTRDLDAIYTREWYEKDFAELGPEFELVAKGLDRFAASRAQVSPNPDAIDVGCGPGMLVASLRRMHWHASGFDGSRHAIEYANQIGNDAHIDCEDVLSNPDHDPAEFVICTEVAEHIPAKDAPTLVRYLCKHALTYIVFTAAPPGQGGHDHVNEQPAAYWVELFLEHGWILDIEATDELVERWSKLRRLSHMIRNLMVFR